jgi:enamine deaminase RidA (YjgF/YER057c/UK114 family)
MNRTSALLTLGATVLGMASAAAKRSKQFLNLDGKKPPGYTHVVTSPPGKMVFISGQGGSAPDGSMPKDFTSQATNTFENIRRCLEAAGAGYKDIVKINYYVTDLANTEELRRIRAKYLNMDAPPAATLVQSGLGTGLLVEIEAVAIVPE